MSSTSRSPADSYADFRRRSSRPKLADFLGVISFELDPFQQRACEALEDGHGVLVCAPTGAGKTVVGEFAVHLALSEGSKCFYTTPIKALSNQKHRDLVERYGADRVGQFLRGRANVNSGRCMELRRPACAHRRAVGMAALQAHIGQPLNRRLRHTGPAV